MRNFVNCYGNKSPKSNLFYLYTAGALFFALSMAAGLFFGGATLDFPHLLACLRRGELQETDVRILLYIRLPRTAAALLSGAALSVAGAVTQSVLANRLASPGIIGVNAGAGLAVTLSTALGIYGGWRLSLFAFLGAFGAVMLLVGAARVWGLSPGKVILLGVAMNSLLGAVSDSIVTLWPDVGVMSADFRMGDFSAVTYGKLLPSACLILTALALLLPLGTTLDFLTLGDLQARGLGMNTGLTRVVFLLLGALLAGCAVSLAGLLSFVGLLIPNGVKKICGEGAGHRLSLCALFGGGFTALCDTAARTWFAPHEIPVGILMAFFGAPCFIFLLIKGKGAANDD